MVGLGLVAIVDIGGHGNMVTWNVRKIWFDTNEKRKCTSRYVHSGTAEKNDGGLTKHLHYVGSNTQFPIICKVWNAHIFQVSMRLKQHS